MEDLTASDSPDISHLGSERAVRLLAAIEIARRYRTWRDQETRAARVKRSPLTTGNLASIALSKVPQHLRSDTHEWVGFVPVFSGRREALPSWQEGRELT